MAVVPLTIVISLCLVFSFVLFFLREHSLSRRRFSSAESESLLPLTDETPRMVGGSNDHNHAHTPGHVFGCRDASPPPYPRSQHRSEH